VDQMGTKPPERLQRALTVLEIPHDVKVYPGSGHRFLSEASGAGAVLARFARMSYQEADAKDAWQRIYAFFGENLAGVTGESGMISRAGLHGRQLRSPQGAWDCT